MMDKDLPCPPGEVVPSNAAVKGEGTFAPGAYCGALKLNAGLWPRPLPKAAGDAAPESPGEGCAETWWNDDGLRLAGAGTEERTDGATD